MGDVQGDGARAAYSVESIYKDKGAPEALKALQADVLKANGDPTFKPTLQAEFDKLLKDDGKNHVLGRLALEWGRPIVDQNTSTSGGSGAIVSTTGMSYNEIKKMEAPKDQSAQSMLTSLLANKLDMQYNDMTSGWRHFFAGVSGGITTNDIDRQAATIDETRADALKGIEKPLPAPPPAPEPVVKAGEEPGIVRVAPPGAPQPKPEQPPATRPPQQMGPETPPPRPAPPPQMRPETPPGGQPQDKLAPAPPPPERPQSDVPRPPESPGGKPDVYGYGESDNAQGPVGEKSVKVPPGGGYWDAAAEMLGYTQQKEGQSLSQRRQELNATAKPEDMHKIHDLMVQLMNEARQSGKGGMLHPGDTITHTFGPAPQGDTPPAPQSDAPPVPPPQHEVHAHNRARHTAPRRAGHPQGHPAPPRQVYYNGRPIEQVNPDEIEYRGDSRE